MTIEQLMNRIEEIAKILEKGEIPLEESLILYEEASSLIKKANIMLDEAEQRVLLLTKNENGTAELKPFPQIENE